MDVESLARFAVGAAAIATLLTGVSSASEDHVRIVAYQISDSPEWVYHDDVLFETTSWMQAQPSGALSPPEQPAVASRQSGIRPTGVEGVFNQRDFLGQDYLQRTSMPATDILSGGESRTRPVTDAGSLFRATSGVSAVYTQRRNPIVNDPRVRGMRFGQLYGSGSYWIAARPDLDTLYSKIDAALIQEMIVIKGPYSAMYGPAFDFLAIEFLPAPRFENGMEWHGTSSVGYGVNGEQWRGRETALTGNADWGVLCSYGHQTANDYSTGGGFSLPTSYNSRDAMMTLSKDLSDEETIEVRYLRADQTGLEFPGQMFDINCLVADAWESSYQWEAPGGDVAVEVEGWYNRTRYSGDTRNASKGIVPEIESALDDLAGSPAGSSRFAGVTDADVTSVGGRASIRMGDEETGTVSAGVDFRLVNQQINERFTVLLGPPMPTVLDIHTNLPRSQWIDPGVFAECSIPVGETWITRLGGRVDWVRTTVDQDDLRPDSVLWGQLTQNDALYLIYVSNQWQVNDHWTVCANIGHAERPPTLVERYADGVFLGILQSGLSRVTGDPDLRSERLWQLDVGMDFTAARLRGGLNAYQAWVLDYATYVDEEIPSITGARLLRSVNTDLATLTGVEGYLEYAVSRPVTVFSSLRYTTGRDQTIQAPLPQIDPLESRVGCRLQDQDTRKWGLELAARIVDNQDRLGTLRNYIIVDTGQVVIVEQPTPGFTVWDCVGHWQARENLRFAAGVLNFTDRLYREHLDVRTGRGMYQPGVSFFLTTELHY